MTRTAGTPLPTVTRAAATARPWAGAVAVNFMLSWAGNQFSPLLVMYEQREHYSAVLTDAFLGVYVLGLAPALLLAGPLSDRHGRKPVLVAGLASAVAGSALLALGGHGAPFLVIGRMFSGAAVGSAMSAGNSWIKELSQPPYDSRADERAGARRGALAFTLGSLAGALVAGLCAQWGPDPEVLPFVVHIVLTLPLLAVVARSPETGRAGGVPGVWWRQLHVPAAGRAEFRAIALMAPWIFVAAAVGYGYLPGQLQGRTGHWSLVYSTSTTIVALAASSLVQPVVRRRPVLSGRRGLTVAMAVFVVALALVCRAVGAQSLALGLVANVVVGCGMGVGLVAGMSEVQRIAGPHELAGLTGVFYAVAYVGFLAPAVVAAVVATTGVSAIAVLATATGLGLLATVGVARRTRRGTS